MNDRVGRISQASQNIELPAGVSSKAHQTVLAADSSSRPFLELVSSRLGQIQPAKAFQSHAPVLHRSARRQVFENIVSSVINEQHPVYSLVPPEIRQDMITAITQELVNSHYLT
jgi:hypothetical protein